MKIKFTSRFPAFVTGTESEEFEGTLEEILSLPHNLKWSTKKHFIKWSYVPRYNDLMVELNNPEAGVIDFFCVGHFDCVPENLPIFNL